MYPRFFAQLWLLCTLLGAVPAQAAWTSMGLQDGVGFFVDAENVETVNGYRRVWVLQNYPSPNVYGAQSMMMLSCSNTAPAKIDQNVPRLKW